MRSESDSSWFVSVCVCVIIVTEKDKPLGRKDFRRPGVLSVYSSTVAGRELNPRARPKIS